MMQFNSIKSTMIYSRLTKGNEIVDDKNNLRKNKIEEK